MIQCACTIYTHSLQKLTLSILVLDVKNIKISIQKHEAKTSMRNKGIGRMKMKKVNMKTSVCLSRLKTMVWSIDL